MKTQETIDEIREELSSYVSLNSLKSLVIGISGGLDSTVCAILARPVCDELKIPLIGVYLPTESNKQDETDRARMIGHTFCTMFNEKPITKEMDTLADFIGLITDSFEFDWEHLSQHDFKVFLGNIKARIRMITLYGLAGLYKGAVLSTDNFTEYQLGFWTLHGDVGDIGMIQYLYKSEVYEIAEYMKNEFSNDETKYTAIDEAIKATPTDGNGVSNSDLDQLGAKSYEEVDLALKAFYFTDGKITNKQVIDRHKSTDFKRRNPVNFKLHHKF